MYKYFSFFLLSVSLLATTNIPVEVNAYDINSSGDIIEASNGIEVIYQDSIIRANRVIYNKKTKKLKLIGDVEMIGYNATKEQAKEIDIDLNSTQVEFKKLFLTTDNDIWIASKKAKKQNDIYTTGASVLSSCDISNPIWKLAFDESKYDKSKEYIELYDTTMYFMDVPVFYSPYLAFTTNNQRKSGFLFPLFGYGGDDGFIYEQPIFWAIAPNMDLEFNPQIRTKRSYGGYSTFRFVDSAYSQGGIRAGYYKDKSSYHSENSEDDSHYGVEFRYDSSKVFSKYLDGYSDGLYINAIYLNDIDYLNLQKTSFSDFGQSALQESTLNYYIQNNDYYVGINAKYFIDTREDVDDDTTLQILPSIQLHKYLDEIFFKNLTYSIDMHMDNYYRKEGVNLKQVRFEIPIEYTLSLFDDFLGISFSENIYYSKYFFSNGDFSYDRFRYVSNLHKIKLFSDLSKRYSGFVHVLQPSVLFMTPGFESQEPISSSEFSDDQQALFDVGLPQKHYELALNQYIYNNTMDLIFSHRVYQMYYAEKTLVRPYRWADLHNEITYNIKHWQLYNDLAYSYHYSKIRESSSYIRYKDEILSFEISHIYRDILGDEENINLEAANELGVAFDYIYNEHWDFNGALTYNIDESSSKQWRVGFRYKEDCWNFSFAIKQEIIPRPNGSDTQNSFNILMNFVPFAEVGASL
jgi:LPS-assembly protein